MVMPRSFSRSMLSRTWDVISRAESPPVTWISRSARVDFPWSIWAMMEKLRIRSIGVSVMGPRYGSAAGAPDGVAAQIECPSRRVTNSPRRPQRPQPRDPLQEPLAPAPDPADAADPGKAAVEEGQRRGILLRHVAQPVEDGGAVDPGQDRTLGVPT